MHEHPDTTSLFPPGTYLEKLPHPSGKAGRTVELAVFQEHRFSFFFWNRWAQINGQNSNQRPTHLVTMDWHRDLAPPSGSEKEQLDNLELNDQDAIAKYTWSALDKHNDSHLLAGAYLHFFDDIYLLKNYGGYQQSTFTDSQGTEHTIREFTGWRELESALLNCNASFLLDIDLDYFVKGKVASHQLDEVEIYSDDEITDVIRPESKVFQHILPRLRGITIATEPRYCGGILKSQHLLEVVLSRFFTEEMQWKHL